MAFAGPVVITSYVLYQPIAQGFEMNTMLNNVTDCLLDYGSGDVVIAGQFDYVTTEEGVIRMAQNAQLVEPSWKGLLTLANPAFEMKDGQLLCKAGAISLYRP